ncbi:MAG: molybdenum cofactor biosynthesis protein MoaB [Promethearchaeota archaeon]|nr:MAG: molybdenum cofactor biosynthesis protein MoaB [Candidatus Lokiarchaeota archaeon]
MKVHEHHKHKAPEEVHISLVIVSTTRYQEAIDGTQSSDKTLPLINEILSKFNKIVLESTHFIPDKIEKIKQILDEVISQKRIDAIIFSGGTGLSPKDITYETIEPLMNKKLPGFGELFRFLSFEQIGPSAMLSRALAGTIKNKIIFLLPGSPNAVKLALKELILPELGHIMYLLDKEE